MSRNTVQLGDRFLKRLYHSTSEERYCSAYVSIESFSIL